MFDIGINISPQDTATLLAFSRPGTYRGVIDRSLDGMSKFGVANMRKVLTSRGHNWSFNLHKNIRSLRRSWNSYNIQIPVEGAYLDSMKPHFVSFSRAPKLKKWYKTKGLRAGKFRISSGMFVRPHPFIDYSLRDLRAGYYVNRELIRVARNK